ncbi:hypothetical protein WME98_20110 [Sorangium sp. So ce296]|uniref:hypothetical protein n=1 Tax=Sorangium sp. So ce296 TaxID=3133296 RepID=UPI003F5F8595
MYTTELASRPRARAWVLDTIVGYLAGVRRVLEVECTTSIYSGLLRMSDLLSLQPNLDIMLYLVAPEERRDKVEQEIQRPTFALREKALPEVCGFLPFNKLCETIEGIRKLQLASSLKLNFLEKVAEYFAQEPDT